MKTCTLSKPRKTGLLKARCEPELAEFYDRRAHSLGLDTADLVRDALRKYANQSQTFPLCPSTH